MTYFEIQRAVKLRDPIRQRMAAAIRGARATRGSLFARELHAELCASRDQALRDWVHEAWRNATRR